jgi:DNA replication and repair protein RecF
MQLQLKSLSLYHFRNYTEEHFCFGPKVNLIYGGNAEGKTNLLEALYFLCTGRSFRTYQLTNLIQEGSTHFVLDAHFSKDNVSQRLKIAYDGKKKTIQHNATSYTYFTPLLGLLPAVIFAPEDVMLINGPPSKRRRFLDLHIAQQDPLYVHHLIRYHRAMKNRNHLLKTRSLSTIAPWEHQMALSAGYLVHKRRLTLDSLLPFIQNNLHVLSNEKDTIELVYQASCAMHHSPEDLVSYFQNGFARWRSREVRLGTSLLGPHKDDLDILLNQSMAKSHASEGQKRSCLSALKLAEVEMIRQEHKNNPLICLDDFGVHLDQRRQEMLKAKLLEYGQIFVTAPTDEMNFPSEEISYFHIAKGTHQSSLR